MPTQKFDAEFRTTILNLYHKGRPAKELEADFSVPIKTIYRWNKRYTPSPDRGVSEDEIRRLKKELARTKEDLAIVKKP